MAQTQPRHPTEHQRGCPEMPNPFQLMNGEPNEMQQGDHSQFSLTWTVERKVGGLV